MISTDRKREALKISEFKKTQEPSKELKSFAEHKEKHGRKGESDLKPQPFSNCRSGNAKLKHVEDSQAGQSPAVLG